MGHLIRVAFAKIRKLFFDFCDFTAEIAADFVRFSKALLCTTFFGLTLQKNLFALFASSNASHPNSFSLVSLTPGCAFTLNKIGAFVVEVANIVTRHFRPLGMVDLGLFSGYLKAHRHCKLYLSVDKLCLNSRLLNFRAGPSGCGYPKAAA